MNIAFYVYIIIIIVYLIIELFLKISKDKKNSIFLKVSFFILLVVLFLRKPYSDMNVYLDIFNYINKASFNGIIHLKYEPLYKVLVFVIGKIWLNERFFIVVIDLLTCIGPYFFIKKYSKNYLYSVLLFIAIGSYGYQFYIIRQALAISILLFSIKYIENRKFIKFLFSVLVATLFHESALVFILVYFICRNDLKKIDYYWLPLIIIFGFAFKDLINNVITHTVYSSYIGSKYDIKNEGYNLLILYTLLLSFSLIFKKKKFINCRINNIMLKMAYLTIFFQIMSTENAIISRITKYFGVVFVILPVNVMSEISDKKYLSFAKFLTILIIGMYIFWIKPIDGYALFNY